MVRPRLPALALFGTVMVLLAPGEASAQTHEHSHDDHGHAGHSHASGPVDCRVLAAPPWVGLPEADRNRIAVAQRSVEHLATPQAARAAGFVPVLGNIPGMGVHYVHMGRTRDGLKVEEPDHLLFAPVDGEEQLVGVAYAFHDVVDTQVAVPFESELARWHDHPELAPAGQTMHMLHLWFVPSSNGPFAGLNFWLPFHGAGIEPPSACWMAEPEVADRIQTVSFALASSSRGIGQLLRRIAAARTGGPAANRSEVRQELLSALDDAARRDDRDAWVATADRFIAELTARERAVVDGLLRGLTMAQMSTPEREAGSGGGH